MTRTSGRVVTSIAGLAAVTLGCGSPAGRADGFHPVQFEHPRFGERAYTVFVPAPPVPDHPLPLIVFLHGSDETGSDGWKHLKVGLGPYCHRALTDATAPRFYALFPQARDVADWSLGSDEADLVPEYVETVCRHYPIDRARVYLTGHSAGGAGVWHMAANRPDLWAALVVVTGGGDPRIAPRIKHLPARVFQGGADDPDLVHAARAMVSALRAAGGVVDYTEYPDEAHAVWPRVYNQPELYQWLLDQRRPAIALLPEGRR